MAHEEPGHPGGLPGLPARKSGPGSSAGPPLSPPSAARRCGGEGQLARSRRSAPRCAAEPVPANQTQRTAGLAATRRQAHLRRQGKSTQCLPPGEWVSSGSSPCSSTRSPHSRRLSPWAGVVLIRGQEHLQRELLVAPVLTQPALCAATGALRSTANSCAVNIHDVNS